MQTTHPSPSLITRTTAGKRIKPTQTKRLANGTMAPQPFSTKLQRLSSHAEN